jgi:hypothetical protein
MGVTQWTAVRPAAPATTSGASACVGGSPIVIWLRMRRPSGVRLWRRVHEGGARGGGGGAQLVLDRRRHFRFRRHTLTAPDTGHSAPLQALGQQGQLDARARRYGAFARLGCTNEEEQAWTIDLFGACHGRAVAKCWTHTHDRARSSSMDPVSADRCGMFSFD